MLYNFKDKIKKSYKSATIWLNGILLAALPVFEYSKDAFPQLQEYLPADTYRTMGLFIVAANIALRFKTDKGLHEK